MHITVKFKSNINYIKITGIADCALHHNPNLKHEQDGKMQVNVDLVTIRCTEVKERQHSAII
jgi:hypothetical protein